MADCQYPPCSNPVAGKRTLRVPPQWVELCAEHLEAVDSMVSTDRDFVLWVNAMLGSKGHG
jgi:hypothetical protein